MTRLQLLLVSIAAVMAVAAGLLWRPSLRIVYNATDSAPLGWYGVQPTTSLNVGDYVLAMLPMQFEALAVERRYLAKGVPVLKPIAAVGRQRVCVRADRVFVDGNVLASALAVDAQQRPLSVWTGCRALAEQEVFLLSTRTAASFDSRYFGPLNVQEIVGRATALWTWRRH